MEFSLTIMTNANPCPSHLMALFCTYDPRYSFNRDRYFSAYIYDQATEKRFEFCGWKFTDNKDGTTTATVFLKEKEA